MAKFSFCYILSLIIANLAMISCIQNINFANILIHEIDNVVKLHCAHIFCKVL